MSVTHSDAEAEPTFTTLAAGRLEAPRGSAPVARDMETERRRFTGEPRDAQWESRGPAQVRSGVRAGIAVELPPLGPMATRG